MLLYTQKRAMVRLYPRHHRKLTMVIDQRKTVKLLANAMSRKLLRDRVPMSICDRLNSLSDPVKWYARSTDRDGFIEGFFCALHEFLSRLVYIPDQICC